MKKLDKRKIAAISLLVSVVVLWIIIIILLYMHIHIFFIAVLIFITAVLVIIENKLLSTWGNKKASWVLWIIGTIALITIIIIGYNILIGAP